MDTQTAPKPNGNAKALTPFEEVKKTLMSEEYKAQFAMALPPQMPPEKFLRVAITAVNKSPELLDCTRQSLYQSFMLAAQDGLLPDGREAAITKFMNKGTPTATYMPMVRGIIKKIRNSGELKSITAMVVYKNEEFQYWIDEAGQHLKHVPMTSDGEKGDVVRVYALAITKDGAAFIDVMTVAEVEKVRNVSRAKDAMAWTQWWDEMAKKTAIRRLSKLLPMSTDLDDLVRRDDHLYDLAPKAEEHKAAPGTPSRLQKLMGEPGKVIEGVSKDVTEESPAAPEGDAPSAAEIAEMDRQADIASKAFVCVKCNKFGTDVKGEMDAHMKSHAGK